MRTHERGGRSRRAVLRAAAAAVVAAAAGSTVTGCDLLSDDPEPPAPPDPLAPLLAGTAELLGLYDAALATHPDLASRLEPIRAAHQAHLTELATLIGTPAPGTPGPDASAGGTLGPEPSAGGTLGPEPSAGGTPGPDASAGGTASPGGSPADPAGTLTALRAAELSGRRAAATACLAAPADRAVLLGYLAAARASHGEVLR